MAFIRPSIIPLSVTPKEEVQSVSGPAFLRDKIDNITPLQFCLYGLATGSFSIDVNAIRQPFARNQTKTMKSKACASQSQYFALACAHDMNSLPIHVKPKESAR